jgi:MFS family permease
VTDLRSFGPRFWVFLTGQAVSAIGSWATLVAIWGYAAYEFDATPTEIGLTGMAWLFPPVVLGPFAGTVIDRVGPRPVLAGAKVLGVAASIALVFTDSFAMLVVFSIGHGISYAFSQPALDAFPPRLVDDHQLAAANSLVNVSGHMAIVVGPVAAAGSIALWDFHGAFVFDALTYVVGLLSLLVVHMHPPTEPEHRTNAWRETVEGFRLVLTRRPLRNVITLTGSIYFLYGSALLLEPVYVRDVLDEPVSTFAYLQTAFGILLVGMGIVVARLGDRVATRAVLAMAVLGSGVGALWYLGTESVVMAYAGVMVWGAFTAFVAGPSRTLLQRNSPPRAQGRVLALDRTMEGVGHLVAVPVTGFLASALGIRGAAAAVTAFVMAVGVAGRIAAGREQPAGPGEVSGGVGGDVTGEVDGTGLGLRPVAVD